jgi:hypothetical protein
MNRAGLRTETIDRFSVTAKFYAVYEDLAGAVWFVQLYPVNTSEFSEIGAYSAVPDAATGESLQIASASDGKG